MLHRFLTGAGAIMLAFLAAACDQGPDLRVEFRNERLAAESIARTVENALPVIIEAEERETAEAALAALVRARPADWPPLARSAPEAVGGRATVLRIVFDPDAFYSGISICQGRRIGGGGRTIDKLAVAAALCADGRRLVSIRAHADRPAGPEDPALAEILDALAKALFAGL